MVRDIDIPIVSYNHNLGKILSPFHRNSRYFLQLLKIFFKEILVWMDDIVYVVPISAHLLSMIAQWLSCERKKMCRLNAWPYLLVTFGVHAVKPVLTGHPREIANWALYRGWPLKRGFWKQFLKRPTNCGKVTTKGKRVNRGGCYGLDVPCKYLFEGDSFSCGWLEQKLIKDEFDVCCGCGPTKAY